MTTRANPASAVDAPIALLSAIVCHWRRAKPEGKKEAGWEGLLPRAAASAALPGAIILPPLRGAGEANRVAGGLPSRLPFSI